MNSIDLSYTSMYNSNQTIQLMDETNFLTIMENINEISLIISRGHNLKETLSAVLDKVLEISGMESGGIYQKDSITGDYVLTIYSIINERIVQKKIIQQNWDYFLPIMNGKVIAIPDVNHFSDRDQNQIIYNNFRSFISIPLILDDINYGTLVASSSDLHEFSELQKRMFSIIGMHIAGYIHNSKFIEQLIKSKEMYYDLFNNAKDIIYIHDLDGYFLSMNQVGLDFFGYSKEEILRLKGRDLLTEESLEIASMFIQQIRDNEDIFVQPIFEVVNKNGDKIFMEFNLRAIIENGKPIAIHGIARNVNKRLQAEKNILIFSKAINLATDGIGISDSEHKISFINESGAKLFGYSQRELLGQPATIFYAEEDLPNLEENITPAMEKYGYWNGLFLGRKKDGSSIPIDIILSSVMAHNGKPLVNIGVFREVKSNLSNT